MDPQHQDANRRMWDERVPIHVKSAFYDVAGFLSGTTHLRAFELAELGEVKGRSFLHLQCHFGLDTLSWAREGAQVTGLDFSAQAIEAAGKIAREADLEATFVESDVHDAVQALGRQFEIVYTGLGSICWLPDIRRWAEIAWQLVKPGGRFYMVEFHPFTDIFGDDDLDVSNHYFDRGVPFVDVDGGTYTDPDVEFEHNIDYTWTHPVSSVITALVEAGFRLELFREHEHTLFRRFKSLEHHPTERTYRFPSE
ncbi:MAG: class I SAM-dependent methyltransferase, partial [Phycisphaerales bacterium]|nr:class I SAM-dependent methyltransferase [Phycisphaerales bacterium]